MLKEVKRFTNSKLRKLVDLCRKDRNNSLTVEESSLKEQVNHDVKQSIDKLVSRRMKSKDEKSYNKYNKKLDDLDKKLEENKLTQEQYDKKADMAEYKYNKAQYELNQEDEKPRNPFFQRMGQNIVKAWKATKGFLGNVKDGIGKFFTKQIPLALGAGAKVVIKTAYKGAKHTIKGVKVLGRGVRFVGNKVAEVTKDIREEADHEMQKSYEEKQENKTFRKAARQQVKAIQHKNPRESLGMQHFEINHEQALERVEGEVVKERPEQQLENE